MNESNFKIFYLPLSKANWSSPEQEQLRAVSREFLAGLPGVTVVGGEKLVDTESAAMAELAKCEAERPGLIVAQFLAFSLGVVVPRFAQSLQVPVALWSLPEPDPQGGRLQRNSFCAVNLNSHVFYRMRLPAFPVHGAPGAPESVSGLRRAVRVARTLGALGRLRVGAIGGRVPGFFTSGYDEMLLRTKLGPEVVPLTELEAVGRAKKLPAAELAAARTTILGDLALHPTDAPEPEQIDKIAGLFAAVNAMRDQYFLDAVTLRCWPEVISGDLYGITVCSLIGNLNQHQLITACEGDVYGAVAMYMLRELSGEHPFFCDLIKLEQSVSTAWHRGAAPCALCRPGCAGTLRHSSTVEGGGVKGGVGEFPLKPGRVTLLRLGEKRDGDGFRMLVAPGEGLPPDLFVRGNPLNIAFDAGGDTVRETVLGDGWEHHYALAYGDFELELTALCRARDIELTVVK